MGVGGEAGVGVFGGSGRGMIGNGGHRSQSEVLILRVHIPTIISDSRYWRPVNNEHMTTRRRSIVDLIRVIETLQADKSVRNPGVWYRTQKEHWLGWLGEYNSPGAYGRKVTRGRDARFAYNHIVEVGMLLYLIDAAGVDADLVREANAQAAHGRTLQSKSAAVRKVVPWEVVERALWKRGAR